MLSSRSALFFGVVAFLLNPSYACSSAEPEYQYGEAELRAAVTGDWSLRVSPSSGTPLELTFHLEQSTQPTASAAPAPSGASLLRSAHACGTRTLLALAQACVDASEMPLRVSFVAGEPNFEAATSSGNFRVDSLIFDVGILYLQLGELRVTAQLDTDGNVSAASMDPPGSSVFLERVER